MKNEKEKINQKCEFNCKCQNISMQLLIKEEIEKTLEKNYNNNKINKENKENYKNFINKFFLNLEKSSNFQEFKSKKIEKLKIFKN